MAAEKKHLEFLKEWRSISVHSKNTLRKDGQVHLFACSEIERAVAFAKQHDGNIEMRDGLPDTEIFRKEFFGEPVLDAPLSEFCRSHHCTERGPKCDRCAYTAMGSSMRRKLGD